MSNQSIALSFNIASRPLPPGRRRLTYRRAYYYLVNIEEHPEILPLAYDEVERRLKDAKIDLSAHPSPRNDSTDITACLTKLIHFLAVQRDKLAEIGGAETVADDVNRLRAFHYFVQYMPTALVDSCWLQNGSRVSTAHTAIGAALTGLYQHQVRRSGADFARHFVANYRAVSSRLRGKPSDVSSYAFAECTDFAETCFALPLFLLSIAQFPRTFPAEIVGLNLVWQFLDLSSLGPRLIRHVCEAFELPTLDDDLLDPAYFDTAREMAFATAATLLRSAAVGAFDQTWTELLRGVAAGIEVVTEWFDSARGLAPSGAEDPRQKMIELLRQKAPHARGYHGERALGSRNIDDYFDPDNFDGEGLLDALSASPWVKRGKSEKSAILGRLINFGGPMTGVFSLAEQQVIRNWIDSLPSDDRKPASHRPTASGQRQLNSVSIPQKEMQLEGRCWESSEVQRRSKLLYGKCSLRDLYHRLVNIEFYPDILPLAERYARDHLERSMATLWKGERAIPSRRYDPAALEKWVYAKHREQIDSYRSPNDRPKVIREAFIEANVQLAPLILIDGGWLQGIASSALIHTTVGRMLFHVFVEEIGEGLPEQHHANIYRNLLDAMGVQAPPVDSEEFAHWDRLEEASFEVPTLWLSISCFPRHFLPEILGINLAVELAGVGGPYMEARDTLRRFRYPTLFVDVHNAADNVTAGHAAWAMEAIKLYLDEIAERDGPHGVDRIWHRVWSGVRATLPQIGQARLIAHRIKQRVFAEDPRLVPLIFPY